MTVEKTVCPSCGSEKRPTDLRHINMATRVRSQRESLEIEVQRLQIVEQYHQKIADSLPDEMSDEKKIKVRVGRKTLLLSREAAAALIGALADALATDTSEPWAWEIELGIE